VLSLQRQPLLNAVKRRREEMLHTTAQLRKDFARCLRDAMRCVRELEKKRALQRAKTNKALQREREQRLAALKNNDMAAYTALLANCKTARLRTLLEQTAQWERKLADMIETKRSAGQRDERQQRNALAREARLAAAAVDAASASAAAAASASSSLSGSQPPSLDVDEPLLDLVDEKVAQPAMLSGGTLTPYQLIGLQWLVSLHNNFLSGVLADEMGLGKTIQTIALIAHLLESKRDAGPYLIVAPKSTLANWAREFAIWAPKIRVVHYSGSREERAELWKTSLSPGTFHVLLVNFELIYNAHDVGKLSRIRYKYVVSHRATGSRTHDERLAVSFSFTVLSVCMRFVDVSIGSG
jgi:SNF2 family DNA or RNA helicase